MLEEKYDPHIPDMTRLVYESWMLVTTSTIYKCWEKSIVLPVVNSCDLNVTFGPMTSKSNKEEVRLLVQMFGKVRLGIKKTDMLYDY